MAIVEYNFASGANNLIRWYYDWDDAKQTILAVRGFNDTTDRGVRGEVTIGTTVYGRTLMPGESSSDNIPRSQQIDPDDPSISYSQSIWFV